MGSLLPHGEDEKSKFMKHSKTFTKLLEEELNLSVKKCGLHSHQIEAVIGAKRLHLIDNGERLDALLAGKEPTLKPIVIVAPTASGKLGMIVLLPYVLESQKVLIHTPSILISEQLAIAFGQNLKKKCFLETVNMISGSEEQCLRLRKTYLEDVKLIKSASDINEQSGAGVFIVNAQKFAGKAGMSLVYRKANIIEDVTKFFKEFDTLIVDEAHHYPAQTWLNIVKFFREASSMPSRKIIFLTATPLKHIEGKLQFILGSSEEAQSRLAYSIDSEKLTGVHTRYCEFKEFPTNGDIEDVFKDLTECFEANGRNEGRINHQAMILVKLRNEADKLAVGLNSLRNDENFAVVLLAGRSQSLTDFTNGKYRVGITCGVGGEGYDNPNVTICVIRRKYVKGTILFSQFIGRCKRIKRGLGERRDQSVGIVFSYTKFEQKKLWDDFENELAEIDPIDYDEDDK